MKNLADFTNQYPLSKTLRFKLIPMGKTLDNIQKSGILEEDRQRAESYVKVKSIIDDYHKSYINMMLSGFDLPIEDNGKLNSLEEYFMYLNIRKKNEREQETFKKIQSNLRKLIVSRLTKDELFKRIYKKELIKVDLVNFVMPLPDAEEKIALISEFDNFTTYFMGFHENRKNMYSDEEIPTAIAYRLVNENFPKFIDNIQVFEKISSTDLVASFEKIKEEYNCMVEIGNVENIFKLENFNNVLTQKQIDVYNAVIGGMTTSTGEKIKGLNEYINLYNQQHKHEKLPKFKILFKQILSDREALSWLPEEFSDDKGLLLAIKELYKNLQDSVLNEGSLKLIFENIDTYDLNGVFIKNDLQLTDISQKAFGNWNIIPSSIKKHLEKGITRRRESEDEFQEKINKAFKSNTSFSIAFINQCLEEAGEVKKLEAYFKNLGMVDTLSVQTENIFARINSAYTDIKDIIDNSDTSSTTGLSQQEFSVQKIKRFLDSLKGLQQFIKPMLDTGDVIAKDERFYGEFSEIWNELDVVTPLYNKVRNYLTKKPYSEEKIKLNFENPTLLDGWDLNKEADNTCAILRKDGMYYLAIMNKRQKNVFKSYPSGSDSESYEKMEYKLLPGANKMLPKVFFSKSRIKEFNPSKTILSNYKKETHKKGDNFNLDDCHALIDFFKESINKHEDWKNFGFKFSDTSKYSDLSGFYREVENQGYKLSFTHIAVEYINQLVEDGKIYLFQIYNKDFSQYSSGTPNMHTLYWKMLFDERNLANVVYKLNGKAEVFFRKSSIVVKKPTHPANEPLKNKNKLNPKNESVFKYDLIKDKRYSEDQFQFHVPITINFKAIDNGNMNQKVNQYLKDTDDLHIIGIDRGERNLLYLVVIDMNGRICKQFSLNGIGTEYKGLNYTTNYHDLLDIKEENRMKARQSWQSVANIKELKEGYLSQVIHKLSELMIEYNAIVVLEDLNFGFMRGRQKVEKQVYQKFEKMLIDKLNYLVFKNNDIDSAGGLLHAYQLTNKFESFKKVGKQSGFLYYIPAWNTSKIDPITGFVNLFDTHYESVEKAKTFFSKFDFIRFNKEKNYFEFGADYSKFTFKGEDTQELWTICTYGTRIRKFRDPENNMNWNDEEVELTEHFKQLFAKYAIDIFSNIKEAISNQKEKDFFKELLDLFKLTLQLRNSKTKEDVDFIISPVANKEGKFYDSRSCDSSMPADADANGAYNIARKGLMIVKRIKASENLRKINFTITNKEWLNYAQRGIEEPK